ncbi:DUF5806 family protein [Halorubrum sp. BV1]|uniref:DUF5806 family protein n=1 Tax=Halorubrum sp. BV1 TaxID=1498500 RepID=UPI000679E940|nr:DUF5806 family protein [Halorubrum sp. BV1]
MNDSTDPSPATPGDGSDSSETPNTDSPADAQTDGPNGEADMSESGGDDLAPDADGDADADADGDADADADGDANADADVPPDVRKYERFKKMDGARYERVNEFLRDRTYITAREWAIARLCADFRTETGVEMTKIGENLPELVPFMTDTYTPQAVNQARYSFEQKVTKAGATFLYGAMSGFFTAEDVDEMMYEVTEVAKFLLEVEDVDLAVADELDAEDRISEVMREVRASSADLRGEEVRCPECGHVHEPSEE